MRVLAPLLAALAACAPLASACSWSDVPPEPAAFVVRSLETSDAWRIDVTGRTAGGTCELANPHALHDDLFAYASIESDGRARSSTLHVHDLSSAELVASWPLEHFAPRRLSIESGLVVYHALDWARPEAPHVLVALDAMTGERKTLDVLPQQRDLRIELAGALVVMQTPEPRAWVYDALAERFLVEAKALPLPERSYLLGTDGRWLVFLAEERVLAYDIAHALLHEPPAFSRDARVLAVDGGVAYYERDGSLWRVSLPDGSAHLVSEEAPPLVSVHDGHLVEGYFSDPPSGREGLALRRLEAAPSTGDGDDLLGPLRLDTPPAPLPLGVVGLLVVALLARPRRHRGR